MEELDEIPETDAPVIFSAHGVPQSVPAAAEARKLFYLDATCPLVSKVHAEARDHHENGLEIVLIGHAGHPEVVGTLGQLPPGAATLIETAQDAARLHAARPAAARLHHPDHPFGRRYRRHRRHPEGSASPTSSGRSKEDICYATTNRQEAVKAIAGALRPADRGRRPQQLQLAAAGRGGRARRLPQGAAGAAGRRHPLGPVRGHRHARRHRRRLGARAAGRPRSSTPSAPASTSRSRAWSPGRSGSPSTCRASCARPAHPNRPLILGTAAWRSTRKSPTTSWPRSSPATIWARCCPTRASPRASRTPTISCTPRRAPSSSRSTRSAWRRADLPFFLGLMEHLAQGRPQLPDARARCPGPHAAHARRQARRARHLPRGRVDPPAAAAPLRRRWARPWRAASGGRRASRCAAPMRWASPAGGRSTSASSARADEIAPGLAAIIEQELDHLEATWPADLPQGVIHADLFPDNVFFLGDRLSGADRLLLRLQRRAGLRRRHRAQRLVLRERPRLQHHQGPGAAQGLPERAPARAGRARGPAAAGARRGAALPADARLRLAAHRHGRARQPQGPAANTCAGSSSTAASARPASTVWRPRHDEPRRRQAARRRSTPTAPARAIRAPAAGARS